MWEVSVNNNNAITPHQVQIALSGKIGVSIQDDTDKKVWDLKGAVEQLESKMISAAMQKYKNTYKAAASLGVSQSTLVRKAKEYHIVTSR